MRKFKEGDKVTVVADEELLAECFITTGQLTGQQGVVKEIGCDDYHGSPHSYAVCINGDDDSLVWFIPELGLEPTKEDN